MVGCPYPFPAPLFIRLGQETIEMCETQSGLYMIMELTVLSCHNYQRPVISSFSQHLHLLVRSIVGQDVVLDDGPKYCHG